MRISTAQIFARGLTTMLDQQARLAKTQEQIATGKKILSPSDDPVGSVRTLELTRALERTQQFQRNGTILDSRLRLEESILGGSVDVLQRVRELAIQANNATQDNESRQAIANEIWQQLESLVNYANTSDSGGNFIFAGYQQDSKPFANAAGNVVYLGDDGVRKLQVGPATQLADGDPGSAIFMNIPAGNGRFQVQVDGGNTGMVVADAGSVSDPSQFDGQSYRIEFTAADQYQVLDSGGAVVSTGSYQSGGSITVAGMTVSLSGEPAVGDAVTLAPNTLKDVFSTLEDFARTLELNRDSPEANVALNNEINAVISNLDQAIEHLVNKQAVVGARLQGLEQQSDTNAGAEIQLQTTLSEVTSLDYAEGITRMNQQLLSLQAAQQSFARVQGLSLFNYL